MSTRSGKRIHNSFHENIKHDNTEPPVKTERKTRSRRFKENVESLNLTLFTSKKRNNYVSYPTDDELTNDITDKEILNNGPLFQNTLKEHNLVATEENSESNSDIKKFVRLTRRTKKLTNSVTEYAQDVENNEKLDTVKKRPTSKKNKKKNNDTTEAENICAPNNKKNKKKKVTKSDSECVEEVDLNDRKNNVMNRSNISVESFHSAAGSPLHNDDLTNVIISPKNISKVTSNSIKINIFEDEPKAAFDNNLPVTDAEKKLQGFINTSLDATLTPLSETLSETPDSKVNQNKNGTFEKETRRCTSSIKNISLEENCIIKIIDTTFDKDTEISKPMDSLKKRKSSLCNETFNEESEFSYNQVLVKEKNKNTSRVDNTFDKESPLKSKPKIRKSTVKDHTADKKFEGANTILMDTTFQKKSTSVMSDTKNRKSPTTNYTYDNDIETPISDTFEKESISIMSETKKRKSSMKNSSFPKDIESTSLMSETKKRNTSLKNSTFDKDIESASTAITDTTFEKESASAVLTDTTFEKESTPLLSETKKRKTSIKNSTFDNDIESASTAITDTTFEKESTPLNSVTKKRKSSLKNSTFDKDMEFTSTVLVTDTSLETESASQLSSGTMRSKSAIKDSTFDKDPNSTQDNSDAINVTFDTKNKRKSTINGHLNGTFDKSSPKPIDTTFDKDTKLDTTFDKNSKSSIISSDQSNITDDEVSRISITSDDSNVGSDKTFNLGQSKANLMNTTPMLIESSMDESLIQKEDVEESINPITPVTPLKREGTFTKEGPEVTVTTPKITPKKRMSLPSPGCTPFPLKVAHKEKSVLNVTRSIEKDRRSSLVQTAPRTTKVMFCSPVNNPMVVMQNKRKVIKSNLKGSNKSFVFEETAAPCGGAVRKRSYTQGDAPAPAPRAKRTRTAPPLPCPHPPARPPAPRARTSSASAKLTETATPSQKITPSKSKYDGKVSRTKLPNFAALHQKQFDKMESLDECQERKARRARALLTPTSAGVAAMLQRGSPQGLDTESQKPVKENPKKTDTPKKSLPTLDSLRPGYTRFGFKMNLDVNPFSIPSKNADVKPKVKEASMVNGLKRQATLPSLAGATVDRRQAAKQVVMREKSFTDKRSVKRNENRTIIKGVRTNRRFELQMKLRNLDN